MSYPYLNPTNSNLLLIIVHLFEQEEQEEMLRKRPPTQKGLTLAEVRKMEYLSKV